MSTDRTVRLSHQELALKLATRDAVKAAGGQDFVAQEVGRTQSRISDYGSRNTAEFMPIDIVAKVEALGAGTPGHPHITRALARAQGDCLVAADAAGGPCPPRQLGEWLADIAGESSDVIRGLASALGAGATADASGLMALPPEQRAMLAHDLEELVQVLLRLQGDLAGESNVLPGPGRRSDTS